MTFQEHSKIMLENPIYRETYEFTRAEFDVRLALIGCRVDKKMTVRQLAKEIGVSPQGIINIELGSNSPTLEFVAKASRVLGMGIEVDIQQYCDKGDV